MVQNLGFTVSTYFNNTTFPVPVDHRGPRRGRERLVRGERVRQRRGPLPLRARCDTGTTVGMGSEGRTVLPRVRARAALGQREHRLTSAPFAALGRRHLRDDRHRPAHRDHRGLRPLHRLHVLPACPWSCRRDDRRADRIPAAGWAWGGTLADTNGYPSEEILTSTLFRVYRFARRRLRGPAGAAGVRVALPRSTSSSARSGRSPPRR